MFRLMFYTFSALSMRSLMTEVTMCPLINVYVCSTQDPVRHDDYFSFLGHIEIFKVYFEITNEKCK